MTSYGFDERTGTAWCPPDKQYINWVTPAGRHRVKRSGHLQGCLFLVFTSLYKIFYNFRRFCFNKAAWTFNTASIGCSHILFPFIAFSGIGPHGGAVCSRSPMGKEQVLLLDPLEGLRFKGPFTDVVISELHLTNPSSLKVAFKVKTTAPKRYCVRPNSGILEPAGKITVQVMLQPLDFDPASEKNKHKFMVQTAYVPEGTTDQDTLWKTVPADALMDTKLRCIFELPEESQVPAPVKESITEQQQPRQEEPPIAAAVAEPVNSQPKVNLPAEIDCQKLLSENEALRKEISDLQKELSSRKEENLRLRKVAVSDTVQATPKPVVSQSGSWASGDSGHSSRMHQQKATVPNVLLIAVFLVAGIVVGIVLSKFLLN